VEEEDGRSPLLFSKILLLVTLLVVEEGMSSTGEVVVQDSFTGGGKRVSYGGNRSVF